MRHRALSGHMALALLWEQSGLCFPQANIEHHTENAMQVVEKNFTQLPSHQTHSPTTKKQCQSPLWSTKRCYPTPLPHPFVATVLGDQPLLPNSASQVRDSILNTTANTTFTSKSLIPCLLMALHTPTACS